MPSPPPAPLPPPPSKREAGELKSTAKVHKKFDRTKYCPIKAVIRVLVWEIKVITEGIILVRARANSLFSTLHHHATQLCFPTNDYKRIYKNNEY